jgi:hypothetical protein
MRGQKELYDILEKLAISFEYLKYPPYYWRMQRSLERL